jgi:hypothetical protein
VCVVNSPLPVTTTCQVGASDSPSRSSNPTIASVHSSCVVDRIWSFANSRCTSHASRFAFVCSQYTCASRFAHHQVVDAEVELGEARKGRPLRVRIDVVS